MTTWNFYQAFFVFYPMSACVDVIGTLSLGLQSNFKKRNVFKYQAKIFTLFLFTRWKHTVNWIDMKMRIKLFMSFIAMGFQKLKIWHVEMVQVHRILKVDLNNCVIEK